MGDIKVFKTVVSIQSILQSDYKKSKIGLVPTMGALHEGHMTLVQRSIKENDCTIVSIFVNPIQFNNASDLENYPRNIEQDLQLLKEQGDVIVFAPSVSEVYPENFQTVKLELGQMGLVMEGKFREGHCACLFWIEGFSAIGCCPIYDQEICFGREDSWVRNLS